MSNKKSVAKQVSITSLILVGMTVILIPLVALPYIFSVMRKLRHRSKAGREVSASVSSADTPLTTFNPHGQPGDPINIQFLGTDGQIGAAFAAAGWYRADEIDFITSARICADSVLGRAYSTAPVSNLYLYGRKEDMAFERPGHTVRQRDHIRIWNTGRKGTDRRPIWIGSVTKDTKVELAKTNHLPTHHISPNVDAERALAVSELTQTDFVVEETTRPGFGKVTQGVNGGGDPYFTDGQVAVITLANVWTPPLATQVRSPLGSRIAQMLVGLVRNQLPKAGLEHASREQQRLKVSDQASA